MSDIAEIAIIMCWVYAALVWLGYMIGYHRGRVDENLDWTPPWYGDSYDIPNVIKGEAGTGGKAVE